MEEVRENDLVAWNARLDRYVKLRAAVAGLASVLNILLTCFVLIERPVLLPLLSIPFLEEYAVRCMLSTWPTNVSFMYVYVVELSQSLSAVISLWIIDERTYLPVICSWGVVLLSLSSIIIHYRIVNLIAELQQPGRHHRRWRA